MPSVPSVFSRAPADQLPGFGSRLLSFATLFRLWTVQHDLLAEGDTRSRGFVAWNVVFLGAVSVVSDTSDNPIVDLDRAIRELDAIDADEQLCEARSEGEHEPGREAVHGV